MISSSAASIKGSAIAPLLAGVFASGGILTDSQTGAAVLIILGGGAFLLSIVVNVMKLRSYSRTDRKTEAAAERADLVSREEMERELIEVRGTITELRNTVTKSLADLTTQVNGSMLDVQNALGRLQGAMEESRACAVKGGPRR